LWYNGTEIEGPMHDLISDFARNRERIPWEFSDMEEREEERLPQGIRVLEPHELEGDLLNEESFGIHPAQPFGIRLLECLPDEVVNGVSRGWD
jgi:hypothetical protein